MTIVEPDLTVKAYYFISVNEELAEGFTACCCRFCGSLVMIHGEETDEAAKRVSVADPMAFRVGVLLTDLDYASGAYWGNMQYDLHSWALWNNLWTLARGNPHLESTAL